MTTLPLSLRRPPGGRPRVVALLVAAALVVGSTYAAAFLRPTPNPSRDAITDGVPALLDGGAPLPLPAGLDPAAAPGLDGRLSLNDRIAFWTARIERHPRDSASMLHLVTAEMAKARLTADLDLYQRASGLLDRAAAIAPGYLWVRELRAALDYTLHDFVAAERTARALVAGDPGDVGARGILADALVELGRYDEAGRLYEDLARDAPGPALDVRRARFVYLGGDDARAVDLARAARDAALADPSLNDVAFYEYQLGEMARLTGATDLAASSFEAALVVRPTDLGALLGLARVEAASGSIEAAIGHLRVATAIAPQAESLAMLGDLLSATGRTDLAATQYATVRTIGQLSVLAGSVYDRQLLLFELDHGGASEALLTRAEAALLQRSDSFGWDAVAWSDYRLGRYEDARTAMSHALERGCRDARLLYHAGAIRLALGDRAGASDLLIQALALGPALDPVQRGEASRLLSSAQRA